MTILFVLFFLSLAATLNYCLLINRYTIGFGKLPLIDNRKGGDQEMGTIPDTSNTPMVSVIIAARNEADNLPHCIRALQEQKYPHHLFEVIVINDQSEDNTEGIAIAQIPHCRFRLQVLNTDGSGGKKQALELGVNKAGGEFLLMTDADCTFSSHWISSMVDTFVLSEKEKWFVAGPVMLEKAQGIFNHLQCLEFNSLLASTAGAIGAGVPVMSNGANMAIRSEFWRTHTKDHSGNRSDNKGILNKKFSSGDDIFSMLAVKHHAHPDKIGFAKSKDALVFTKAHKSIHAFFNQRFRWVSKSSGYPDFDVIYSAVSVFIMNALLLVIPLFLLFDWDVSAKETHIVLSVLWILVISLKTLFDFRLIRLYTDFFGQKESISRIAFSELIIAVYTVTIAVLGNILPFSWKGRKLRR